MSYTLYAPPGSFRAFATLIAAEYNGIKIDVSNDFDLDKVKALSPTGTAPILQLPTGEVIFRCYAMARYVASLRTDTGLYGQSIIERGLVDSWIDFCVSDIDLPATIWTYPVLGYMPFHKPAYEKAKIDFAAALTILNKALLDKTYLVGDHMTLADITVCSSIVYPFKIVCDANYLQPFPNIKRWFNTCVNEPNFISVIGVVTLAKEELKAGTKTELAIPTKTPTGDNKGSTGKKEDKANKKQNGSTVMASTPSKKTEHPYKIMDKESPSGFSIDSWKRTYSNTKSCDGAMKIFWDTFDSHGWSVWLQTYNHNEDNKRVFMCSNGIAGFQQRTESIRRWAFGVMHVLGEEEESSLEIAGVWLLRGNTVDQMIETNDDANWYTWKKLAGSDLDPPTNEVKEQVMAYWFSQDDIEGKPIQDSKVFK